MTVQSGDIVVVVMCVEPDEPEVTHIFSSMEKATAWADQDWRAHVISTYVVDVPEHHEERQQ